MFVYIIFSNAFEFTQTRHKAFLKYKEFTIISFIMAITSAILSILLVNFMEKKYFARILGLTLPTIIIGLLMYIRTINRAKKCLQVKYWKYALELSIPLILHVLSGNILSQFDRIAIANITGFSDAALYGMAYNIGGLLNVVLSSFNGAWVPWFYQQMQFENFKQIREVSRYYIALFSIIGIALLAFAPEMMLIMAPPAYYKAIYVIPPVILGIFLQFIYTLYVNIEFYNKKTLYIPVGTVISAVLNIILNLLFIPQYGYIVAAYTTLIGYASLLVFHFVLVKVVFKQNIFNTKDIFAYIVLFTVFVFIYTYLYQYMFIRYIFTILVLAIIILTNREKINKVLKDIIKIK